MNKILLTLAFFLISFLIFKPDPIFAQPICCSSGYNPVAACESISNPGTITWPQLGNGGLLYCYSFSQRQITACSNGAGSLIMPDACPVSASSVEKVIGQITPPPQVQALGVGGAGIGRFLGNLIRIIFLFAGIVAVFMILISAFQMITSGGDKEAVGKARGRLTYAIIGLVLLALTFVIINIISRLTGFQFPISQR